MAGLTNLYPPIVDTYMPAFIATAVDGNCNIYFSLSKYNSLNDIKSVWVSVSNQYTNESVLADPLGLKAFAGTPSVDETRDGDDKYYITLNKSDLKDGEWALNQLYKVQIRFCSLSPSGPPTMAWITQNSASFSEWSTVCLIQGIASPKLIVKNFSDAEVGVETIFSALNNKIVGHVEFTDDEELESYHFSIYKTEDLDTPVYESGTVYTEEYNPNEINYSLDYAFVDGDKYKMIFTYKTKNLYEETHEYSFLVIESGGERLNANISAEQDEENGCIRVTVISEKERFFGNLTIRRAASDTNFSIWEDVHTTSITSEDFLNFQWEDYTVESGIWYKYGVQKRNSRGDRGLIITIAEPVMVTLQDMFLTRAGQQLRIKFNPQVSGFKKVMTESLTQTLGSKYPYIKRNGNVNYRQFSISGLISHFSDENESFITQNELYKNRKDLYDLYNDTNLITEYNDFTLERTFREKVIEFLTANDVKLFRSPAEGNILVRLMDVNLTPEQTLGRMLYSFSATAYEIDDITAENYEKYGIQKVGTYSNYVMHTYQKSSQYSGTLAGNLYAELQAWETLTNDKGLKKTIKYIDFLDLEFQSDPYLIITSGGSLTPVTAENKDSITTDETTVLGYLLEVNGSTIIIGKSGRFTLSGDNIQINSISVPVESEIRVNYNCLIEEAEDVSKLVKQVYYTSNIGQIHGGFDPDESIGNIFNLKYTYEDKYGFSQLYSINSVGIEAAPRTLFYVKDSSDTEYRRYMIGESGYLNIEDKDYSIKDLAFFGINLEMKAKAKEGQILITRDEEFDSQADVVYQSVLDIHAPVKNGVYLVRDISKGLDYRANVDSSKSAYHLMLFNAIQPFQETFGDTKENVYKVIYYKGGWYQFTNTTYGDGINDGNDVILPTSALIDYRYEIEKGEY